MKRKEKKKGKKKGEKKEEEQDPRKGTGRYENERDEVKRREKECLILKFQLRFWKIKQR